MVKLRSPLARRYGHDLVNRYEISVTDDHGHVSFLVVIIVLFFPHSRLAHKTFGMNNMTGATSRARSAYFSRLGVV